MALATLDIPGEAAVTRARRSGAGIGRGAGAGGGRAPGRGPSNREPARAPGRGPSNREPARAPGRGPSNREPPRAPGRGLKIGEVARAAGVGRGTVQHYLRLGLLPHPRKSARNMAWYDPACVERIRAIRELRERRFLPLPVIARMVRAGDLRAEALAGLPPPPPRALDAAAVERDLGVPRAAQRELGALGLVDPVRRGGREAFAGDDLEVLRAVGDLRRAGFVEKAGFSVRDLGVYRDTLARLQREEARVFRERSAGMPPERAARLARAGAAGGTALIVALRRKLLRRFLQGGET